jgi:alpha-galactosidase
MNQKKIARAFKKSSVAAALFALSGLVASASEGIPISSLDLGKMEQGWGKPHVDQSVDGHGISIGGQKFDHGVGTHATSSFYIDLKKGAEKFTASVGVDDEVAGKPASVEFEVLGDEKVLWKSGVMKAGDAPKKVDVDLKNVGLLLLLVTDGDDGDNSDHADWADAQLEVSGEHPQAVGAPRGEGVILTPKPGPEPRINGAKVFGVRPGSPFLFTIAATGERPMTFSADDLPPGLKLDSETGRITGTAPSLKSLTKSAPYTVTLRAKNAKGVAEKKFRIVVGEKIALTPPMGWNSWNCFAGAVSADRVKRAADAMVSSGLINHGWTFINIDDFWQNHRDSKDATLRGEFRDKDGVIVPNSRFPDMKALADYIHGLGLKAGLYSSPGPWTCGGCAASWQHEEQDAETYAAWGFDYLKYDWCSYGSVASGDVTDMKTVRSNGTPWLKGGDAIHPYEIMGKFLRAQNRDIVFSLCQYGMDNVWEWGAKVDGNCWRTTGDITDTWRSMSTIGFNQDKAAPFAKPGNWNDPDMLIVGHVGWGRPHPTRLTPDEQYTHISLWCLLSAPLLIGCDMEKFDDFTLNLLTNDEVLDIDQDPLGKQAVRVGGAGDLDVYAKPLEDGSLAVGLFNRGRIAATVTAKWSDLGIKGKQVVRDLWRQKDAGTFDEKFEAPVAAHGVVLIRLIPAK